MKHKLELEETYKAGAEKWLCPECGYEFVATWLPFKRVVTVQGDETAVHYFHHGGVIINNFAVSQEQYNLDLFKDFVDGIEEDD